MSEDLRIMIAIALIGIAIVIGMYMSMSGPQ